MSAFYCVQCGVRLPEEGAYCAAHKLADTNFDRLEPESLKDKLTRLWRKELARREFETTPCFICQFPKDLHDPDGSHLWSPRVVTHEPGAHHQYEITCKICGQRGTIRLTVDPETAPVPGEEADHG